MKFFGQALLVVTLLSLGTGRAQLAPSPTPAPSAPSASTAAASASTAVTPAAAPAPAVPLPHLPQAMTLVVQGFSMQPSTAADFSQEVFEPDFALATSLDNPADPANPIQLVFSGTVQLVGERYLVNYDLTWKAPASLQTNRGGAPAVSYRNLGLQGSVYLRVDHPEVILAEQGRKLLLTIKTPAKKAAGTP